MSDLIDSIARFRNENPEVASALKRGRDGEPSSNPREESNYYHSAPSFSSTSQSAGGDTKNFLEGRDRERDSMGVNNWVHKHRDEIAAADSDRLAKRLEAEQNFADAQNAIEGFKRDSAQGLPCPGTAILSAGDPGGISVQPDVNRPAPSNRYDLPHSSVYSQPVRSLLNESTGVSSLSPPGGSGRGGVNSTSLSSKYSPSRFGRSGSSTQQYTNQNQNSSNHSNNNNNNNDDVVLDTKTRFGDIDESSNYEAKRKLLGSGRAGRGDGSLADRVSQSLHQQQMPPSSSSESRMPISNALAAWSRAHPNDESTRGGSQLNAPLTATVRTAASNIEPDSQSVRALMDTIGIRDATIARLESQIREERRFHESAMSEIKAENETLKETLRRYNADTEKKVEEIRNSASAEVRFAKEQHARELDQAKIRFDQRVKAVEDDMSKSLAAAKANFENQVARIDDLHDASASQFRETLRTERSDALNREKNSLVELLAREQEVLLRDGEQRILTELTRQLSERARTELQRLVQQQTTEVLLPSLKELVTRDVVRAISDRATSAAEQHVEDRSRAMRGELERILEEGEKRLEEAASRLAAGSVVRWSGVVPLIEGGEGNTDGVAAFKHHAELMRKLQEEADKLIREQRDHDHQHAQKITSLKAHLEELQSELKSQKQINEALAERLVAGSGGQK